MWLKQYCRNPIWLIIWNNHYSIKRIYVKQKGMESMDNKLILVEEQVNF